MDETLGSTGKIEDLIITLEQIFEKSTADLVYKVGPDTKKLYAATGEEVLEFNLQWRMDFPKIGDLLNMWCDEILRRFPRSANHTIYWRVRPQVNVWKDGRDDIIYSVRARLLISNKAILSDEEI